MATQPEPMALTPTASLFLSLSEELASASKTYNPAPDIRKGELIKYPEVSLEDLSAALKLCWLAKYHLSMCDLRPKAYGLSASCMRDVFDHLGKNSTKVSELIGLLDEETTTLVKIRFKECTCEDLRHASHFCFLMHSYFHQIESKSLLLGNPTRAITERALSK